MKAEDRKKNKGKKKKQQQHRNPMLNTYCFWMDDTKRCEVLPKQTYLPRLRFWQLQNEGNFSIKISKKVGPLVFKNH